MFSETLLGFLSSPEPLTNLQNFDTIQEQTEKLQHLSKLGERSCEQLRLVQYEICD